MVGHEVVLPANRTLISAIGALGRDLILKYERVFLAVALGYANTEPMVVEEIPGLGVDSAMRCKAGTAKGGDV